MAPCIGFTAVSVKMNFSELYVVFNLLSLKLPYSGLGTLLLELNNSDSKLQLICDFSSCMKKTQTHSVTHN